MSEFCSDHGPSSHGEDEAQPAGFRPLRLFLPPHGPYLDVTSPECVLGRHSSADLRLPLPDVSRRHCRLSWENGTWRVIDLDSMNGVYINEVRVREAPLQPGDTLRLGGFTFQVELADPKTAARPETVLSQISDCLPNRPSAA